MIIELRKIIDDNNQTRIREEGDRKRYHQQSKLFADLLNKTFYDL